MYYCKIDKNIKCIIVYCEYFIRLSSLICSNQSGVGMCYIIEVGNRNLDSGHRKILSDN